MLFVMLQLFPIDGSFLKCISITIFLDVNGVIFYIPQILTFSDKKAPFLSLALLRSKLKTAPVP